MNGSADTLAYYKTATITALNSFIVQAPVRARGSNTVVEPLNTDLEL